jgi:hypothetical protein
LPYKDYTTKYLKNQVLFQYFGVLYNTKSLKSSKITNKTQKNKDSQAEALAKGNQRNIKGF